MPIYCLFIGAELHSLWGSSSLTRDQADLAVKALGLDMELLGMLGVSF